MIAVLRCVLCGKYLRRDRLENLIRVLLLGTGLV